MSWTERRFLFIDCQTTATHPSQGQLLEVAWCRASIAEFVSANIETHVLKLAEGNSIPQRVREMTRITDEEIARGQDIRDVVIKLKAQIDSGDGAVAVAHYAVFEKTFLEAAWKETFPEETFPLRFLCTQKICKALFPRMTSYSLRAVSGFFGSPLHLDNRAESHVEATLQIWLGIVRELEKRGLETPDQLEDLLKAKKTKAEKKKTAETRFEYRMPREKRLQFPDQPGIYKMFSKDGKILYIGKATSLRSRVNSYFRGGTTGDKRKQELMAQVWDIEVVPCRSPLESALLESDEIKKWRPRYNVALRQSKIPIVFFNRDFTAVSERADRDHSIGPFKGKERLDQLLEFYEYLQMGVLGQPFWDFVEPELIAAGWTEFRSRHDVGDKNLESVRCMLAFGMRLWRAQIREDMDADANVETENEEGTDGEEEPVLTASDVADKFERMFIGAAYTLYRSRKIRKLLWARVRVVHKGGEPHYICIAGGSVVSDGVWRPMAPGAFEKTRIDPAAYDRLSILLSGLQSRQDVSVVSQDHNE